MRTSLALALSTVAACQHHHARSSADEEAMIGEILDAETYNGQVRKALATLLGTPDESISADLSLTAIHLRDSDVTQIELTNPNLCNEWGPNVLTFTMDPALKIEEVFSDRNCPGDEERLNKVETESPEEYNELMLNLTLPVNAETEDKFEGLKVEALRQWSVASQDYEVTEEYVMERMGALVKDEDCDHLSGYRSNAQNLTVTDGGLVFGFTHYEATLFYTNYTDYSAAHPANTPVYVHFRWSLSPEEEKGIHKLGRAANRACPDSYETKAEHTIKSVKIGFYIARHLLHSISSQGRSKS